MDGTDFRLEILVHKNPPYQAKLAGRGQKCSMAIVTVLMTSYNHEDYLAEAIESVLGQTFGDLELLILDDCSTDGSPEIARQYERQDSRVTFIPRSKNEGKAHILNEQLPRCDSEYVALLDSDDYWLPNKLHKQLALFESSPTTGVVYAEGVLVDSRSPEARLPGKSAWSADVDGKLFSDIHNVPAKRNGDLFQELLKASFIFFSSAMVRRDYLRKVRFREDRVIWRSDDWYFFIDLARLCEFAYLEEPLAAYRIHGHNRQDLVAGTDEMAQPRRFVLETYGQFMPRRVKAEHLKHLGNEYHRLGNYLMSLAYLKRSLLLNPLDAHTWGYAIRAMTHGHEATERALRRIRAVLFK